MAHDTDLFDIERVREGVYLAIARMRTPLNSNAAIFVNAKDALVVDTHCKPSAAAALIDQIKREVTEKPVRYVVNTHFHDDHIQGNAAYRTLGLPVDIIASKTTAELMAKETHVRLKATMEYLCSETERVLGLSRNAGSAEEKSFWDDKIRQFGAFQAEMKDFSPVLPTITFEESYVIKDREHDLHIQFHGKAHTAGDVVVFCPQKRVVVTGDMIHDQLPYMPDSFPKSWPKVIDSVGELDFDTILPGHGPAHHDRRRMKSLRNYLDEITARVEEGKKAGRTVEELQEAITVESIESLTADGYGRYLEENRNNIFPHWGRTYIGPPNAFKSSVKNNIRYVYRNLDRMG